MPSDRIQTDTRAHMDRQKNIVDKLRWIGANAKLKRSNLMRRIVIDYLNSDPNKKPLAA